MGAGQPRTWHRCWAERHNAAYNLDVFLAMRFYLHMEKIEKTYTAAGVAEKLLTPKGPAKPEIIRTIRHYAGIALLMPVGAVNTERGISDYTHGMPLLERRSCCG